MVASRALFARILMPKDYFVFFGTLQASTSDVVVVLAFTASILEAVGGGSSASTASNRHGSRENYRPLSATDDIRKAVTVRENLCAVLLFF